jgi:hypothetical protein
MGENKLASVTPIAREGFEIRHGICVHRTPAKVMGIGNEGGGHIVHAALPLMSGDTVQSI